MSRYNRRHYVLIFFVVILVGCCLFGFAKASAGNPSHSRTLVAKSVKIHAKDTLWSIASEYYTDDYESIRDFIEEIKETNGMNSDYIHTGNYIIVPYYSDIEEPKAS